MQALFPAVEFPGRRQHLREPDGYEEEGAAPETIREFHFDFAGVPT
jgi:hypothetical protein